MARGAADSFIDVNAVVEIDVIRQPVHPFPVNGLFCAITLADDFQISDVVVQHGVAVHAGFCRRNPRVRRIFHAGVTIPAVDSVVPHVVFVAELHRLLARDSLVGNVGRPRHNQHASQAQSCEDSYPKQAGPRKKIRTAIENLCHLFVTLEPSRFPIGHYFFGNFPLLNPASVSSGHPATA